MNEGSESNDVDESFWPNAEAAQHHKSSAPRPFAFITAQFAEIHCVEKSVTAAGINRLPERGHRAPTNSRTKPDSTDHTQAPTVHAASISMPASRKRATCTPPKPLAGVRTPPWCAHRASPRVAAPGTELPRTPFFLAARLPGRPCLPCARAPRGLSRFCPPARRSTTRSSCCPLGLALPLVPALELPLTLARALALALALAVRRKIEQP